MSPAPGSRLLAGHLPVYAAGVGPVPATITHSLSIRVCSIPIIPIPIPIPIPITIILVPPIPLPFYSSSAPLDPFTSLLSSPDILLPSHTRSPNQISPIRQPQHSTILQYLSFLIQIHFLRQHGGRIATPIISAKPEFTLCYALRVTVRLVGPSERTKYPLELRWIK